jgi:hypothetical protein
MRTPHLILILALLGCDSRNDSWFAVPPDEFRKEGQVEAAFCLIPEDRRAEYVEQLHDRSSFPLSFAETKHICGDRIPHSDSLPRLHPFVVRALFVNEYGYYRVVAVGHDVWIDHESLAGRGSLVNKSALITFLANEPNDIYVTAYADE